ncbi:Rpn family recombination-promoting nuclease/putative transposase [Oscillatoria salina]|uniref:Rpn family recombination-promoting nuclease/putative transposase n=1 Tax=Oscillatoria salina TaxID=331517 RepID=UPI001CCF6ACC|nr:Rpn family recombination-promoting nuclease/putative transposase [Oscillatoria salina]MBZ8182964.1 Rpn family recombination-promoting nuclease/putative transposase [Oscillatoria salina IIICB1]
MYDNTCKFIAEMFSADIASWLLGEPITLTKIEPSELSVEPIRADSLILLQSEEIILHAEFQTEPSSDIAFRMADYRLRTYRRYPEKPMRQVVIYLRRSGSDLVYQNKFEIDNFCANFEVIRLWEQPTEVFLRSPGLFPFAVLSQTNNPNNTLRQVAGEIEKISDNRQQSNVSASVALLAGLVLEKNFVKSVLRQQIMRESVIYQDIEAEATQKGIQQGIQREAVSFALRLLKRRIGEVKPELQAQIQELSVEQLEELGEALLDFSSEDDLISWLEKN